MQSTPAPRFTVYPTPRGTPGDARLPIKIKRFPGGYTVNLADDRKLWIYGREPEVACAANSMTLDQAEQVAKAASAD